MKPKFVIQPLAQADLDDAADRLEAARNGTGPRFLRAALCGFRQLAQRPGIGQPINVQAPELAGLRVGTIPGFRNYLVFYLETPSGIEVVRVLHGARDLNSLLDFDAANGEPG